jgi:hypothetical protein
MGWFGWTDNGNGTSSNCKDNGEQLHAETSSKEVMNSNHAHTYPNGEYSFKTEGKNSGGSNEANSIVSSVLSAAVNHNLD